MVISAMTKPAVKITVSDNESEYEGDESDEDQISTKASDSDGGGGGGVEGGNDAECGSNEEGSSDEEIGSDEEGSSNQEGDSEEEGGSKGEGVMLTNEGWADSVAKILGTNKPKTKKTLVLSRAKKHSEIVKKVKEEKPAFEVVGESEEIKTEIKKEEIVSVEPPKKKKKEEKPTVRIKPNILEKDRERLLSKIATKGVVQLFNAVRNQQKTMDKELDKDLTEAKKEKILKKFDKRAFLDTLMGQTKSIIVDEQTKSLKNEVKPEEEKPKWSALRDDFMMGAKMKDWDKELADD
ncbi:PREDICTED: RRP15-like protein [Papilio polytes]|uniref:RRP15-like protein n=1 Tax=Papilio polytes TaxID=76194 RepID=UPI0006766380|nr:PREDICTED: RRP15-like protein [Papilio polytes]